MSNQNQAKSFCHIRVLLVGLVAGASSALFLPYALAQAGKSKTSVGEDIYKSLFSKKRVSETEQKRARSNAAIMGVRGLDDDTDASIKATATANMRAVYEMEDRSANPDMVNLLKSQLAGELKQSTGTALPTPIENTQPTASELEGEIDLGRKMAAQLLGANKAYKNAKVTEYVTALTQVLADAGLMSQRPFRIAILDSEKINAFACPGGYIFITKGALRSTRSESQLAALLGHEIVHVSKRHLLSSLQKKITGKKADVDSATSTTEHSAARQRVKADEAPDSAAWAQVLGPKGVGLTLLQASSEALDTLLSKGLEQEFELEADRLGQQVSSAAGYDARSLFAFLNQMRMQKTSTVNSSSSTHPPYDVRLENISRYVETMINQATATAKGSKLFTEMQREWSRK